MTDLDYVRERGRTLRDSDSGAARALGDLAP